MHNEKVNQAVSEFKQMMSRPIFESVEGMARLELRGLLAKEEAQPGVASTDEVSEGERIRICETPAELPEGIPASLKLSDGECRSAYSNGPERATQRIWRNTYTVRDETVRDVRVSFFPKEVEFGELVEYYGRYYRYTKDKAALAPDDVKRDIVKIFAGYACPENAFMDIFGKYACRNAYGTVRQKAADAKKREKAWKMQTLRGIGIDEKFAPIATPGDNDISGMKRFQREIDALFGGNAYETFVPDEYEEIEGARRGLDDWDVYRVNLQNTIGREEFWKRIFDRLREDYDANLPVKASELVFWFEKAGSEIAEEALKNYKASENELIHRGICKS